MELREKDTRKVVAALKCCANDLADCADCYLFGEDRCRKVLVSDAMEHIEELEKEVEYFAEHRGYEWINAKDRLPENTDAVLVLFQDDEPSVDVLHYVDGLWRRDKYSSVGEIFVTHWMPLPEPPKPKEPTFKDKFLEMFPKAELNNFRVPVVCAGALFSYLRDSCNTSDCSYNGREYQEKCYVCWNQPYFEEEGGEG